MKKIEVIYDIEVYHDRFSVQYQKENGPVKVIDDLDKILNIPFTDERYLFIGFNNRRYDQPILEALGRGKNKIELYEMSKRIIHDEDYNAISWNTNIVDLYEICPRIARTSLKEFGHRLGYPILENLPYAYDSHLTDEQWAHVKRYGIHDVNITKMLWDKLKPEYQARQSLKRFFDIKTEFGGAPTLAQKCILSRIDDDKITTNIKTLIKKDNLKLSSRLKSFYDAAFDFSFENYLNSEKPEFMDEKHVVNGCTCLIRTGGLHGISKPGSYNDVYDYDVASYYPSIILNCELGSVKFRRIYQEIYNQRLRLKANKSPHANALKLVLNSLFGKLNDYKYADPRIYAPNLALSICLLGQFYILDLMEKLDGNETLLANTDGIIVRKEIPQSIIDEWEARTGFKLERKKYKTFILKDVNSYYAVDYDGQEKRKKEFLTPDWSHNVKAPIIQKAVLDHILKNIDVLTTIKNGTKKDYLFFAKATGERKLLLNDQVLDDSKVRFYVATEGDCLARSTVKSITRIVKDSPIKLFMDLEAEMYNVNYEWYAVQAQKLIDKVM